MATPTGIRSTLRYEGPLPAASDVKVEINRREHLAFPLADQQEI